MFTSENVNTKRSDNEQRHIYPRTSKGGEIHQQLCHTIDEQQRGGARAYTRDGGACFLPKRIFCRRQQFHCMDAHHHAQHLS